MASSRRRSLRKLSNYVGRLDKRVRRLSRQQYATGIGDRVIQTANIDLGAITYEVLDPAIELDITEAADDAAEAITTANGKNRVYRQASQPTGGTYVDGDLWFDTDDDNKIYRYSSSSSAWVGFTLGNNALQSLSANKITAGTIDASVITVSNLDAGNIVTGTLSANRISGGTLSATVTLNATTGFIGGWEIVGNNLQSGATYAGSMKMGPTAESSVPAYAVEYLGGTKTTIFAGSMFLNGGGSNAFSVSAISGNLTLTDGTDAVVLTTDTVSSASVATTTLTATYINPSPFQGLYTAGIGISYQGAGFGPGNNNFMALQWTGTQAFAVIDNVAGQYLGGATFSDRRYKLNIAEPDPDWTDKILNQLKIWQFNKVNPLDDEDLHLYPLEIGVIADEYKQVFPQWESSILLADPDGDDAHKVRSVNYTGLIPGLVLIAQTFKKEIDELKQRIALLEAS